MSARKRGRETAFDMLRTLAVVFAVVLPLWFFGQASPGDSKKIRPVDPREAYAAFATDTHGPVVGEAPVGWTCTVRDTRTTPGVLRVGYVHADHYLEFVGGRGTAFLADATGRAQPGGVVDVAGVPWREYRSPQGIRSLVLTRGDVTVVVGGVRQKASTEELLAFARAVS